MKIPKAPHRWNVSPKRAADIQRDLAGRVSLRPMLKRVRLIAGADMAYTPDGTRCIAGVVVWDIGQRCVVEQVTAVARLTFPYVPGLLSFREAPALLAAIGKMKTEPDAYLFDGQGYAHPRRFGLACHLGVILDRPSAGCGKSRLVGTHVEPGPRRGARRPLRHDDETIGTVLRTRDGVRCVYVSVGHKMDLGQAVRLVLDCGGGYRLPEPTRLADQLVASVKRSREPAGATA